MPEDTSLCPSSPASQCCRHGDCARTSGEVAQESIPVCLPALEASPSFWCCGTFMLYDLIMALGSAMTRLGHQVLVAFFTCHVRYWYDWLSCPSILFKEIGKRWGLGKSWHTSAQRQLNRRPGTGKQSQEEYFNIASQALKSKQPYIYNCRSPLSSVGIEACNSAQENTVSPVSVVLHGVIEHLQHGTERWILTQESAVV